MTEKKQTIRRREPEAASASVPAGGGGHELLPHVEGWGAAAREARDACASGAEALEKLKSRQNVSGE